MPNTHAVRCDQCVMASINGVACHETGCPNAKSRWSVEEGRWIKQIKCVICGYDCDEDCPCCVPEGYSSADMAEFAEEDEMERARRVGGRSIYDDVPLSNHPREDNEWRGSYEEM